MMDFDLIIIFAFVIILTTILGITVNGIVQKILDYKREKRGLTQHGGQDAMIGEVSDRTDLIEDRLRVLERLATDRGALLSDEIEALRDDRKEREFG